LYKYKGFIFTHKELLTSYNSLTLNHPDPSKIKPITQLLETGEIEKIKYQCIKITEPCDINDFPLSHLKLYLIEVNSLNNNFLESYDTLIEKSFGVFWDYDKVYNKNFTH